MIETKKVTEDPISTLGHEELEISLHALASCLPNKTMWVKVIINSQELIALVDSGSTHNFIMKGWLTFCSY